MQINEFWTQITDIIAKRFYHCIIVTFAIFQSRIWYIKHYFIPLSSELKNSSICLSEMLSHKPKTISFKMISSTLYVHFISSASTSITILGLVIKICFLEVLLMALVAYVVFINVLWGFKSFLPVLNLYLQWYRCFFTKKFKMFTVLGTSHF